MVRLLRLYTIDFVDIDVGDCAATIQSAWQRFGVVSSAEDAVVVVRALKGEGTLVCDVTRLHSFFWRVHSFFFYYVCILFFCVCILFFFGVCILFLCVCIFFLRVYSFFCVRAFACCFCFACVATRLLACFLGTWPKEKMTNGDVLRLHVACDVLQLQPRGSIFYAALKAYGNVGVATTM